MTENASLKRSARALADQHGLSYAAALAVARVRASDQIDLLLTDRGEPRNGSLSAAIAATYLPLLKRAGSRWRLVNTGPGWNQLMMAPRGEEPGADNGIAWVTVVAAADIHGERPLAIVEALTDVVDITVPLERGAAAVLAFESAAVRDRNPLPPRGAWVTDPLGGSLIVLDPLDADQLGELMAWAAEVAR